MYQEIAFFNKPSKSGKRISETFTKAVRFDVGNPSAEGRALDRDKLFRRFAPTSGAGGNGLGLAIAKAVCDFHHWDIGYRFTGGAHRFIVSIGTTLQK